MTLVQTGLLLNIAVSTMTLVGVLVAVIVFLRRIKILHDIMNSRLDALLASTAKASRQEGVEADAANEAKPMRYFARALLTATFLVAGLAVGASAGSETIGIRGGFCNTAAQIDALYQGIIVDQAPPQAVATTINKKAGTPACGVVGFALTNIILRIRRSDRGAVYYFYEADAVGFATARGFYLPMSPILRQHWWMTEPLAAVDRQQGA